MQLVQQTQLLRLFVLVLICTRNSPSGVIFFLCVCVSRYIVLQVYHVQFPHASILSAQEGYAVNHVREQGSFYSVSRPHFSMGM